MQAVADILDVTIPRKIWTRDEAHALVELGFPNAEKLELIEGELIDHMGKKRPHVIWQNLMQQWLGGVFGFDRVESESPTDVAKEDNMHSEPEPDLKVLRKSCRDYSSNPLPEDILMVVEISDSTLKLDLKVKARLYARAALVEYWVLDVPGKKLIVHREPAGGLYTNIKTYHSNEAVAPLAAPNAFICLDRL